MKIVWFILGYIVSGAAFVGLRVFKQRTGKILFDSFTGRMAMLAVASGLGISVMWPIIWNEKGLLWVLCGFVVILGTLYGLSRVKITRFMKGEMADGK